MELLEEFFQTEFFTALEIFLILIIVSITKRYLNNQKPVYDLLDAKKRVMIFRKLLFWTKNKDRFNDEAVYVRNGWADEIKSNKPNFPPQNLANSVDLTSFFIKKIVKIAPHLLASFYFPAKIVLYLPFDVPKELRGVTQCGLPSNKIFDPKAVSAYGFYFLLTFCIDVFSLIFPVTYKKPVSFAIGESFYSTAQDFIIKDYEWELENVEDELGEFLDKELNVKRQT